jgi:hypothetical protein
MVLDLEDSSWAAWTTLRSEGNARSHPDDEPRESSLCRPLVYVEQSNGAGERSALVQRERST